MDHRKFISTLASFVAIVAAATASVPPICRVQGNGSRLGLYISPILNQSVAHEIEIQWNNVEFLANDEFAVYREEPSPNATAIYKMPVKSASGTQKTGLSAEFISSGKLAFKEQCLRYHVAWLRNGSVMRKECLRTRPNWMAERRNILGPRKMTEIFLPGTHNAGSYAIYTQPGTPGYFEEYAVTQDIDILGQLIRGARYLDIRVAYYHRLDDKWWVVHGIYAMVPLKKVVDQVKTFLNNTEEIVIFDIQEFSVAVNNNRELHHTLIKYLEEEFAGYISDADSQWATDLETIWASKKRLIIGYDDIRMNAAYRTMWRAVQHQWGNVRTLQDLDRYLNLVERLSRIEDKQRPRSAMAELTANAMDVILNRLGGLRKMAESVNFDVTNWYSTRWQNTANIVSVDFLRSSGIVEVAIEVNDRRYSPCSIS